MDYNLEPFFELTHDLLCIAGYDGFFKRVNPALTELLGYSKEELYGLPIDTFIFHLDKTETAFRRDELRQSKPLLNFNNRYIKKNGEVVWLSWTSIPLPDQKLVYAIAKNITQQKILEAEKNKLLAEYLKTNEKLKLLSYSTTHNLKSPIANMEMIFELIDKTTIEDPETMLSMELLKSMIDNLKVTLSSYQNKVSNISIEESSINSHQLEAVIGKVCVSIKSIIDNSDVKIETDFEAFSELEFNLDYLESIFLNLITNSIKYSHTSVSPIIRIETRIHKEKKQIIYSDNGIGFDMDLVGNKVFGLHQKFTDNEDSTGIGLYLVYHHLADYGGTIELDSKLGKGSTFTITFK